MPTLCLERPADSPVPFNGAATEGTVSIQMTDLDGAVTATAEQYEKLNEVDDNIASGDGNNMAVTYC